MGGNVGIIVKKENGEQIGMNRWTNVMPHHFKNIDLYLGNTAAWFESFSSEWLKMKDDYERNKGSGQFENNMTDVYFPHDTLSPREYGIIAVDFKNKKIYSSQDYCSIGTLAFYNSWSRYEDNEENEELIRQYFNNGFIKEIRYFNVEKKDYEVIDISSLKVEDVIQLLNEILDRNVKTFSHPLFQNYTKDDLDLYSTSFLIESDWKFTIYHDRGVGILKIKKELEHDGFIFTQADNNAWKEYVSYRWEGYDEDELKDNEDYQEFKGLYLDVFGEEFVILKE